MVCTPILSIHTHDSRTCRFSAFQVVSAYTNTGTSLQDQSMVPFQRAYLMIFIIIFLILAGNTAFVSTSRRTRSCRANAGSLACIVSVFIGRQLDRANHEHSIHVQFAVRHVRDTLISDWCRTQTQAADGCLASSCPKDPGLRKLCTSCLTILDDASCISSHPIKPGSCSRFCFRSSE